MFLLHPEILSLVFVGLQILKKCFRCLLMFPFCQNHLKLRVMRKKQRHSQNCCSLLRHTLRVVYKELQATTGWWVIVRVARCTCVCWMRGKKEGKRKRNVIHFDFHRLHRNWIIASINQVIDSGERKRKVGAQMRIKALNDDLAVTQTD